MSNYLLVAYQTGESREVLEETVRIAKSDPDARFTLLVPATPVGLLYLLNWETRNRRQIARDRAQRIATLLRANGVPVVATRLGNADPMVAIEDALRYQRFDAVVVCTLPAGLSHWLRADLPARVKRRFPSVRVMHIVAHSFLQRVPVLVGEAGSTKA
jgi:hypothetical protein